jgi:GrpB-like predicted nucleotidyltransferase (UPF0157 family)
MSYMSEDNINIHNRPNRSYELVDYEPDWASRFNEIATNIAPLFGDNLLSIEHVGSTAVPGMIAKPTIDVSVVVKDLALVPSGYDAMKQLGFQPLGNFIQQAEPEEYFVLNGENNNDRLANIHVMQIGNPEIDDMITLRDFLRSDKDAARDYIEQKKLLLKQYGQSDYNAYSKNKRSFLEQVKTDARNWKSRQ